jgi:pseudouridine-5'-phosphate glycosidase
MIQSQIDLGLQTGMLFAVPIPEDKAADSELMKKSIDQALAEADEQEISGAKITPFLLKRVAELSKGNSSDANVELIKNNAAIGAQIAVAMCGGPAPVYIDGVARSITIIGGAAVDIIS